MAQPSRQSFKERDMIFRERAETAGFSEDEIQFELAKKHAALNSSDKIARRMEQAAGIAPTAFAGVGGITGLFLGTAPGAFLGGAAGYGAGKAVEDILLKAAGIRVDTPEEAGQRVTDVTKEAGIAGATNVAFHGIGKGLKFLKSPTKSVGGKLEAGRAGTQVPTGQTGKQILDALKADRRYIMADAKTQKAMTAAVENLINKTGGGWSGGPGSQTVSLNDLYKNLGAMRGTTDKVVYDVLKGSKSAPGVVSEALRPLQTKGTQTLAKLYGPSKFFETTAKEGLRQGMLWGPRIAMGGLISRQLLKPFIKK
jgi:hypothetical protein